MWLSVSSYANRIEVVFPIFTSQADVRIPIRYEDASYYFVGDIVLQASGNAIKVFTYKSNADINAFHFDVEEIYGR